MLNNYYKKEIIKDPRRIVSLAIEKKSIEVFYTDWRVIPCAFIQNWQFKYLITLINQRRIREHETNGEKLEKAQTAFKKEFIKAFKPIFKPIIKKMIYFFGLFSKEVRREAQLNGEYQWGLIKFLEDDFGFYCKDSVLTKKTLRNILKR